MKRVTLIITAVLTVLMLTACSSNKVVYERNTGKVEKGVTRLGLFLYICAAVTMNP